MGWPALLDPRNGPAFDLPPCAQPRSYVLASTPRTGSTLLTRLIADHGGAGMPKEYLNPMQLRDWAIRFDDPWRRPIYALLRGPAVGLVGRVGWSQQRVAAHLRRVRLRRSSGGWFGLKIHWHHLRRWRPDGDLEAWLGPIVWFRIRRRDRLAQAVSWEIAHQTNRWVASQRPWRPPIYQRARITARLLAIEEAEAGWDALLAGRTAATFYYEDVARDPTGALRTVLHALDVPPGPVPPLASSRSTDPRTASWIARYRAGR